MSTDAPYVGLDYFLEEDAGLFFGRDAERKRIIGNLRASRLTLLYAESGVGKSSLLRAGVSARLRQLAERSVAQWGSPRYVPVVFSAWQGDSKAALIAALEAAVRPLMREDAELALERETLEEAIEDVVATVDATPLVILDQFEERFLYDPADDGFDEELAHCINRRDLRANFLISVREDAYSLIGPRFKARITNVYGNYLHLEFLNARAARDAILEPVKVFNERRGTDAPYFEVETALVDAVIEQVRRGRVKVGDGGAPDVGAGDPARVETAYLQLVMKRLWDEEVGAGSQRLRLETLRRLGGADSIVHGHLDDVMAGLPADERDAAAAAFRFLVTSSGRKIALSSKELRDLAEANEAPLEPALEHLERARILRPIPSSEPGGVPRHEIYHDVLAPAILEWRRRHVEERTERGLAQARERTRRLEVRNRRLSAAVVALTAVAAGLALYLWNPEPLQRLELRTVDTRFAVRGARVADPRLVLISVDSRTLSQLDPGGTGRIPRARYADMLNRLREDRPAVIALDVIFQGARDPQGDRALLEAIRATHDRLVLPSVRFVDVAADAAPPDSPPLLANLFGDPEALLATRVRTGFPGLPDDKDGSNRRADYRVVIGKVPKDPSKPAEVADVPMPTFAFAAADIAREGALQQQLKRLPRAKGRNWGGQTESTTWIDFRGPPGTVRRVSALDLLDDRLRPGAFRDKLVVIGVEGTGDVHTTPLAGGQDMSGPEVQANALDTMLRGGPLRDVGQLVDILAILVLASVPALASLGASRTVGTAAIAMVIVAYLAVTQLAFHGGWMLAVVAPLAGLAVAALGVAALVAARTLRRRRAREAAA